jgi:hypothetical protein
MLGGVRRTHDFPHGRPLLLTLVELAFAISFIVFAVTFGFKDWRSAMPTVAIFIAFGVTYSMMIRHYEQTERAVRRRRVNLIVSPAGFPNPLLAARCAFFVVVGLMLVFGVGPFGFDVATKGIVGCVFALIGVALANVLLERNYVKTGRATEVEFTTK